MPAGPVWSCRLASFLCAVVSLPVYNVLADICSNGGHCFTVCMQGNAVYAPEKEAMLWKIKNFPGGKEFVLRCKFALPSVEAAEEQQGRMPPIRVNFEIPYFTVSGIQVRT